MKRYFLSSACTLAAIAMMAGIPVTASAQESNNRDQNSSTQQDTQQDRSERSQRDRDSRERGQRNQRDRDRDQGDRVRDQRDRDRDQRDWNQRQRDQRGQRDQDQSQRSRRSDQSSVRVVPQGWVRMGADYDNDGRFDAIETIYLLDLQQAQQRSQARARSEKRRGDSDRYQSNRRPMSESRRMRGDDARRSRGDSRRDRRIVQLSGEIARKQTSKLAGKDQPFVMAHIDTQSGDRVCTVLGPQSKLKDWDLQEGDRVQLRGVRARLNDRKVVMADRVSHDGNTVKVELPSPERLKRARGEILDLRTVRFKGHDQPFVVAQVETPNDKKQLVNLGPKSKLEKLDLKKGDEVRILARPGKISGRQAMIAQEIFAGDQRIDVPRPEDSRRFRQRNKRDRDRS